MSSVERAEFENICLELWKKGYTNKSIAIITKKRLDLVNNILSNLAVTRNQEFLDALNLTSRILIVKDTITIKRLTNLSPSRLYEVHIEANGRILLIPFNDQQIV